jgi:Protein of unknown function (DUF1236)
MKTRVLTAGVILGALMLPVAAHAQVVAGSIVGAAVGGPVGAVAGATIGAINAGALSAYVTAHTYPSYYYQGDVVVGATLPAGVTYYRVPTDYYGPAYYTVVNGHTVLVDPNSGKILQVIN